MAFCDGVLYAAARCLAATESTPDAGSGSTPHVDFVAFYFALGASEAFPYVETRINSTGAASVLRYSRPSGKWKEPIYAEPLDPKAVTVRTGELEGGWWAVAAIRLSALGVEGLPLRANVVRGRGAYRPFFGWADVRYRTPQSLAAFGLMTIGKPATAPAPRLELPLKLAVGLNRLVVAPWGPGYALRVNGAVAGVDSAGRAEVAIEAAGYSTIEIIDAAGAVVQEYRAAVARPLTVEAVAPFQADVEKPMRVSLRLAAAGAADMPVTVEAGQGALTIARVEARLAPGTRELDLPTSGAVPGEVALFATADVSVGAGPGLRIEASHWCAIGVSPDAVDKFRDGIDELDALSRCRAGLSDAGEYYRLIQAGDGTYRSFSDGVPATSIWDDALAYGFALLYKADWPENAHRRATRATSPRRRPVSTPRSIPPTRRTRAPMTATFRPTSSRMTSSRTTSPPRGRAVGATSS